jgi:hypothetical protein
MMLDLEGTSSLPHLIVHYYSFSYLAKGIVEKLEVVNKKWVRVRLMSGNTVDGSVSDISYC